MLRLPLSIRVNYFPLLSAMIFLSELFVQMTRLTFWKIIDLECVPTCVHEKKASEKKE